jgi:hypothetical protein
MTIEGTWNLEIKTPIGKQHATVEFERTDDQLTGRAVGTEETVPLRDITVEGNRVSWKQSITRPLRLNLVFEVNIDRDTLVGTSKAGRLPSSKVTGHRA